MNLWIIRAKLLILVITGSPELTKHQSSIKMLVSYHAPIIRLTTPTQDFDQWKQLIDHLDGAQEDSRLSTGFICKFHSTQN